MGHPSHDEPSQAPTSAGMPMAGGPTPGLEDVIMAGMEMSGHHSHAPGKHVSFECDGTHWTGMGYQRPSNFSSHILPGILVSVWALHWTLNIFRMYLTSSKQRPYRAQTTYGFPFIPASWPVEGVMKAGFAFVGIMMQLWWSHGHWSDNICPSGTQRAGHFSITAVHNWQNAWTLFSYLMAGVVDMAASGMTLPPHYQHFTTAAAFGLQAFGLYQGSHQDMLDAMVYYLLFMAVGSTAAAMTMEMALPGEFWVGCLKAFTMWMQAAWYFATAHILFAGSRQWETLQPIPDMSPEMYVPVVFVMWMNIVAVGLVTVYIAMRWYFSAHLNEYLRAGCTVEKTLVGPGVAGMRGLTSTAASPGLRGSSTRGGGYDLEAKGGNHELVPLVARMG